MSDMVAVDGENFITEVIDADRPVLLDCWAAWCGPCRMLAPELEALALEEPDRLKIAKLDCDDQPELAQLLGISLLPTMLLFVDGVVEASLKGYRTKDAILDAFAPLLKTKKASDAGG
jgi:thioredoxin